jgi:hypothetical protein
MHGGPSVPGPQNNLRTAVGLAVENLRGQDDGQLAWLGATRDGENWRLSVLNSPLQVRLGDGRVLGPDGLPVRPACQIIVLHYLGIRGRPELGRPELTFAHLPDGLVYAVNYEARVIRRLCATAGRDAETLRAAASAVGAKPAEGGNLAFDIDVLPRLRIRLIWHAGDEEFGPSAAILLPRNVAAMFCIEDVVVLSEMLVNSFNNSLLSTIRDSASFAFK